MDERQPIEVERPRSLAEIIGEAFDVYQRYPLLFMTLALAVIAPYELAVLAASGVGPLADQAHVRSGVRILLFLLDYALVAPLVSALHVHAVMEIGQGDKPRLQQVAARGLRVLPVVAAAVIVAGLGIAAGLLALIVPGIILALRWAVVAQVAAVENEDWLHALRRSGELTRGHYWRIFALLAITGLLSGGVTLAATGIPLGSASGAASVALGIVVRTITASFTALTLALLYFDLRARSRGLQPQPPADQAPPPPEHP
jgi:hypothetical protein